MRKIRISLLLLVVLALSAVPFSLFIVTATGSTTYPNYEPIDLGASFRNSNPELHLDTQYGVESSALKTSDTVGNDIKIMLWYDDLTGLYTDYYVRAAIGDYCEVWVNCYSDGTFNLNYPKPDDHRNDVIVTTEQLEYLAAEFDRILPIDRGYFGTEDIHDGSNAVLAGAIGAPEDYYYDPEGKSIIMISNIGDESYIDETYPNYIAGFYWSTYEYYFDRNIINIDAYDFAHRVGTEENSWFLNDDKARPNLYESVIAHEYQHLIHADLFPGDVTWMNEACSLFAEPLCGYELDLGQVDWFLATPDNSLTNWGEQGGKNILADYGSSFLWALYLTDHYGFNFLQNYVQANWIIDPDFPTEAEARIEALLPDGKTFNGVFHDWRLANLIHSRYFGSDKYNYVLDELRAFTGNDNQVINWDDLTPLEIQEVEGKKIPWTSSVDAFGETLSLEDPPEAPLGWPTGYSTLDPYSTDYIRFTDLNGLNLFQFDGDDNSIIPLEDYDRWTYNGTHWYSGMDSLTNCLIATPVSVGDNGILHLNTYWDIEDYWDFAFVQVSLEGTWESEWTSLELEGITTNDYDPSAHPDAVANLPGITGWSGDYVDLEFSLAPYAGMDIYIGFRYVTDWNTEFEGWYLHDVEIFDDAHTEGYSIEADLATVFPAYPEGDFMVSIVTKYSHWGHVFYTVYDLHLNSVEYGATLTFDTRKLETIIVVSSTTPKGYIDYQFKVGRIHGRRRHHC